MDFIDEFFDFLINAKTKRLTAKTKRLRIEAWQTENLYNWELIALIIESVRNWNIGSLESWNLFLKSGSLKVTSQSFRLYKQFIYLKLAFVWVSYWRSIWCLNKGSYIWLRAYVIYIFIYHSNIWMQKITKRRQEQTSSLHLFNKVFITIICLQNKVLLRVDHSFTINQASIAYISSAIFRLQMIH